jgi:trk system potassium uptake protein TrkH
MKVLRVQLMAKLTARELRRVQHPRAVLPVDHDGRRVPETVLARVAGFVLLYVTVLTIGTLAIAALRTDLVTAGSAAASALGSIGPALGEAGPSSNYLVMTRPARGVVTFLMLLGRLELFPLLLFLAAPTRRLADLVTRR